MKISDVMTPNPKTVMPTDDVQVAARIMRDEDAGSVPVVEEGRVVGMVTDRDIVIRAVADGDFDCTVADICSDDVVCVRVEQSTADAAELMSEHQIRRLPVVDGDRPVGIVSLGDIVVVRDRDSVLADISAAPPNS